MGYSYRNGGQIKDFWPDDTPTVFFIAQSATLEEIIERARERFGNDVQFKDLSISAQHIHTSCLTYDLHDSSDYTEFLEVSWLNPSVA